jgi:4-hydroxymandelate oxidase
MSFFAWELIDSGAGDELTVRWNEEAYQKVRLRPQALVDISHIDTRIRLFGRELPHPILLAPASSHTMVHPEGEVATARGAGAAKATMLVSTWADKPIEEIAKAATQPLWFAAYVMKERERTKDLVQRAEAAGFEAMCILIDTPVIGARDREHRYYRFKSKPILNKDYPINYYRFPAVWKDVEWIRSLTKLPIVLKGIMNPDDADLAIRAGAAAVYVSNHGGRNLDTLPATLEVLPQIADKVAGRVPVLMDGGIRRGTDILKALALGATATLIGRPYFHGLSVGGAEGVTGVINILRNELEMAMALTGRPTIDKINRSVIYKDY